MSSTPGAACVTEPCRYRLAKCEDSGGLGRIPTQLSRAKMSMNMTMGSLKEHVRGMGLAVGNLQDCGTGP